jgi:hypothetical protein
VTPSGERGGIVVGWLIKIVVSLAIVAVVAFEGGALVLAHVGADTAATDASGEAALAYSHSHDASQARAAAQAQANMDGVSLTGFSVSADGKTVTVTVEKRARTIVLQRLSFTRSWTLVRVTRTRPVPR